MPKFRTIEMEGKIISFKGLRVLFLLAIIIAIFSCGGNEQTLFPLGKAPPNLEPYLPVTAARFAVIGDSRGDDEIFKDLEDDITDLHPQPQLAVHLGDMITDAGSGIEWKSFHQAAKILTDRYSFYPVVGNHDVNNTASQDVYQHQFPPPASDLYYEVEFGDILMIFLDSEIPGEVHRITGDQFDWLSNLLATKGPSFKYRLAFLHEPLFPTGEHKESSLDTYPALRDQLHQLFVSNHVELVFVAHEHLYDRLAKDGVTYVTSGGGGAPLVDDPRSFFRICFCRGDAFRSGGLLFFN